MAGKPKGSPKTGGRAKGIPNKVTRELKDMILGALDDAGGQAYLARQADENPGPFMTLVGKCLPKDINLDANVAMSKMTDEELNDYIAALAAQAGIR